MKMCPQCNSTNLRFLINVQIAFKQNLEGKLEAIEQEPILPENFDEEEMNIVCNNCEYDSLFD